jgi:lipoprotein-anchoring transpeptidase ErfK/SrfK
MSRRTVQLASLFAVVFALLAISRAWSSPQTRARRPPASARGTRPARQAPAPLPCGDLFAFQVLLDRQGFSPGQIDGMPGANFTRALTALQHARHVNETGEPDCETWHALGGDSTGSLIASYTISEEDVKGPFTSRIPTDLVEQASLPALGYRTPIEKLAEAFHVAPALLERMNRGVALRAGQMIQVPAVQQFDPDSKPTFDPAAADITIQVSRDESSLRAIHADGTVAFFAPVTTGSEHDPLPPGDWKVTSVDWHPAFHYNPNLFWDAKPGHSKATIKPGPNNPVGVAWINLSLEHYGLHGTPEPGHIGHTESHGCVRMTNWDAARLASLVKPGTPVQFR